jgi:CRP-like cAMP-binding protein
MMLDVCKIYQNLSPENPLKSLNFNDFEFVFKGLVSQNYKSGSKIFESGQRVTGIFLILDGVVKISQMIAKKSVTIRFAGDLEMIGQRSVFSSLTFKGSAICKTDVKVVLLPLTSIQGLLLKPDFACSFIKFIVNEIERAEKILLEERTYNVSTRLIKAIKSISKRYGVEEKNGNSKIPFKMTKVELADLVGASKEVVIRQMSEWKTMGLILEDKKQFIFTKEFLSRFTR